MDIGKWTDSALKKIEQEIKREYTKAYNEIRDEMSAVMAKLDMSPDMSSTERLNLMNKYERMDNLCKQMSEVLRDTNKAALNFVTKSTNNIYKQNYNYYAEQFGFSLLDNTAVKNILTGEVDPFTMIAIDSAKDRSALQRSLTSELTVGLLKGESINQIAGRLKNVSEGQLANTVRIARTEVTRVQNSAVQDVCEEGEKLGFDMMKRWVATPDERTREAHLAADGQEVKEDQPFHVGGEELMYPGDISLGASAANVVNCRCRCVAFINWKNK